MCGRRRARISRRKNSLSWCGRSRLSTPGIESPSRLGWRRRASSTGRRRADLQRRPPPMDREVAHALGPGGDLAPSTPRDDRALAATELPLLAVDAEDRGTVEDDHEHVPLLVDVLRRARPGLPGERGDVQLVRRQRIGCADLLATRALAGIALREQRLGDALEKPLDQREQPSLLETYVRVEQLAELAHDVPDLSADGDELLQ